MVQVRQQPVLADGSVNLVLWLDTIIEKIHGTDEDKQHLQRACELSQQLDSVPWHSVTPAWGKSRDAQRNEPLETTGSSFATGLEMAQILAELRLDANTLLAAVLYRPVREGKLALTRVEQEFGTSVHA